MSKTHHCRFQRSELPNRGAVHPRVECRKLDRLSQTAPHRRRIAMKQDIAKHQYPVALAPERQMSRRVSWCLDHGKSANLISLTQ
jgi:hypothetical protein